MTRLNRTLLIVCHDMGMACVSLPLALYLRLGDVAWRYAQPFFLELLAVFMIAFSLAMLALRQARAVWRYVSLGELHTLAQTIGLSIIASYGLLFLLQRLEGVPRSLPVLQAMVLGVLLTGPRLLYRSYRERPRRAPGGHAGTGPQKAIPILVAGANDHSDVFIRSVQRAGASAYRIVALLEVERRRHGDAMRGIPIVGGLKAIDAYLNALDRRGEKPQRLVLTDAYMSTEAAEPFLNMSERHGLGLARLPRLTDFQPGTDPRIRPVAIEDLLGRAQCQHDHESMERLLAGRVVMVTGAGGSIGSELVRLIVRYRPRQLVLVEQNEYALYRLDHELETHHPEIARMARLADIRHGATLSQLMVEARPDILFHAAALKHVPLAEANPEETIWTNVLGTYQVAQAGLRAQVGTMVLVSTDKAVHPANVMGASKRVAEYIWAQAASQSASSRMVMVRFGNVLGSTGSVVPLFQKQLEAGGPLTVTHPEMERYFMTIREAAGLVIQAAAQSRSGASLYVLDMGKPIRIMQLAEQMVRLAGYRPYQDIAIEVTGLRPGEKLREELVYAQEALEPTAHPRIRRHILPAAPALDPQMLAALQQACEQRDGALARYYIMNMVTAPASAASAVPATGVGSPARASNRQGQPVSLHPAPAAKVAHAARQQEIA